MDTWVSKVNLIFFSIAFLKTLLWNYVTQWTATEFNPNLTFYSGGFHLSGVIDHFKIPLKAMDPLSE